ncbi:hypothetical protein [Burkholderia ubonensis]|uniref:hypothetical protein n=1 Tax=Burkholderia ubonensis TaxID=101571 RepID=UPI0007557A9B|nr:hypothetical protein [Burkholderia ubonensis]KVC87149.1 hypothetical protein WI75_28380 [Burkholderia ubonensis]KVL61732.1 hypothetical protein WJ48_27110 [Burkholderia ubonensis]KVL68460.1 hypothetical protein WJ49_27945 [Burkholderia ubonensis]KVM00913.1 hypothetical protein WJ50_30835 [Burkholderia ubonensis]KVZ46520.1 hypothetical protein WL17_32610 [Burkholderia ubonensis]
MQAARQREATAITNATNATGAVSRNRTLCALLAGMCAALFASGAGAAGQVSFSGALVAQYDVTLAAPSVAVSERAADVDARDASVAVTFDAHDRRLPGARIVLADVLGVPLGQPEVSGVRATWRDAASRRIVPPRADGVYRVGPHGGTMMVAAPDAGAAGPIVMKILHP